MRAEGQSRALFAKKMQVYVKRRSGSVAIVFGAAQPCGLHGCLQSAGVW